MRRFYIGVLVAVAIIGVFWVGTPYFFGFAAKGYTNDFVKKSNETLGQSLGLQVVVKDYKRGWFESTATLLIEKPNQTSVDTIQQVPLVIKHGPVFNLGGRVHFGLGGIASTSATYDKEDPYHLSVLDVISFNGAEHAMLFALNAGKKADFIPGVGFDSLKVSVDANINAKEIAFFPQVRNLHVMASNGQFELTAKEINGRILAHYLKPKHWQFVVGVNANDLNSQANGQLNKSAISVKLKELDLAGLNFDTQTLSKRLVSFMQIIADNDIARQNMTAEWLQFLQQFVSDMVQANTHLTVSGLTVHTPVGPVLVNYKASFPLLPKQHDYFDVAMHDVGQMDLKMPYLHAILDNHQLKLLLNNLMVNGRSNTFLSSQSTVSLGSLKILPNDDNAIKPIISLENGLYSDELTGSISSLSQSHDWRIDSLCVHSDCFKNIDLQLQFVNLDTQAFREMPSLFSHLMALRSYPNLTQQQIFVLQWADIMSAYAKLLVSDTKVVLKGKLVSPKGDVELHGNLAWADLPKVKTVASILQNSVYQLRFLFPAAYVDDLLTAANGEQSSTTTANNSQLTAWLHYFIAKNYLKKINNAYLLDLQGKGASQVINGHPWVMPKPEQLGLDQAASQQDKKDEVKQQPLQQENSPVVEPMRTAPVTSGS